MKFKKAPHIFVILICIILFACLLTYWVPSGQYERLKDIDTGQTRVIPNSFHYTEIPPVPLWKIPSHIFNTLVSTNVAQMIFFVLIIGGAFEIFLISECIEVISYRMIASLKTKRFLVIPLFLTFFSIIGFSMGLTTASIIFVPIGLTLSKLLSFDDLTGISMIMMGTNLGFAAGIFNPFSVGIAQTIAELPLFSGSSLRIFLWLVLLFTTSFMLIKHAKKVSPALQTTHSFGAVNNALLNAHGVNSIKAVGTGEDIQSIRNIQSASHELSLHQKRTLFGFCLLWGMIMIGVTKWQWGIPQIATAFMIFGVVIGLLMGYDSTKISECYVTGFKKMTKGIMIIGLAATTRTVLTEGQILDTLAHALIENIQFLPQWIQLLGVFYSNCLLNLLITSGSGQAALVMPILTPLSDVLGLTRQAVVLAFQLGDGLTNITSPLSTTLMGVLAVSNIQYNRWLKFYMPFLSVYILIGTFFIIFAGLIGY
ncbi:YfcC family protein [Fusibacter sp. 3D3]|uniref:YfcC family protein n=1 Tax=Fusibacter sp. 3D3 TaxID=1048380 RepID=UPI000852BCF8|nr:AbgT family transporter [Fusibacter sp. 3D3]GAU77741.1 arginine/ornithine antiporter ArcD [Fusibacter sp. 3D3]